MKTESTNAMNAKGMNGLHIIYQTTESDYGCKIREKKCLKRKLKCLK